jgi:elongation factor Tu
MWYTSSPYLIYLPVYTSVRDLLNKFDLPGDDIPVIKGSALVALTDGDTTIGRDAILALIEAVEMAIPTPVRETDKPFLMTIEDTL